MKKYKRESIMTKEEEYHKYIDEHISNVKYVWNTVQKDLPINFSDPERKYLILDFIIQEHDKSKYSIEEFNGYRQYFYPKEEEIKNRKQFDIAWNHHQKNNPHHWEYWVMLNNDLKPYPIPMQFYYIIEMLCDWAAMSLKFKNLPSKWFEENKYKMILHDKTYELVKEYLPYFDKVVKELS